MFGEKMLTQDNRYTSIDLLNFVQLLLRESSTKQARLHLLKSNYGWLQSRPVETDTDLESYKTTVSQLSSPSRAAIAFQLDGLTEEHLSAGDILTIFEKLINEQQTISAIENNIKKGKEKKKIYPKLSSGRKSSVSFIID